MNHTQEKTIKSPSDSITKDPSCRRLRSLFIKFLAVLVTKLLAGLLNRTFKKRIRFSLKYIKTRSQWQLRCCVLKLLHEVSTLPYFSAHKSCENGDIILSSFTWTTWSHVVLRVGASHSKSQATLFLCSYVFCKWTYNVFNLSCDLTRSLD